MDLPDEICSKAGRAAYVSVCLLELIVPKSNEKKEKSFSFLK